MAKGEHASPYEKAHSAYLGDYKSNVTLELERIHQEKIIERIWQHDHTVWKEDPTEIINRLGWLHSPRTMLDHMSEIVTFVDQIRSQGFTQALLLGMGGSSLAPEVFRFTFGVKKDYIDLHVLDSTHPGAVLEKEAFLNIEKTLFIVSTKSGGTVETISLFKYFYNQVQDKVGQSKVGDHFIAITDPDSGLESMALDLNFRKIFLNNPNIGGRYSALSFFGLVPAALIGVDIEMLLKRAVNMTHACERCHSESESCNTCALLGTAMAALSQSGCDKLTLIYSPQLAYFGPWVEQLIAESTGKEGKGILPVDGEMLAPPENYGDDRLFIYLHLEGDTTYDDRVKTIIDSGIPLIQINLQDLYDLGAEFFRWELATAISSHSHKINPFDQPNVEAAKVLARKMVAAYQEEGKLPQLTPILNEEGIRIYSDFKASDLAEALHLFFVRATPGREKGSNRSYVSLQVYLNPSPELDLVLQQLRTKIQMQYKLATTVGYGPRFLHSTGQLHKGDGGSGLFIQFIADIKQDIDIPDKAGEELSAMTFGTLITAQALGDRQALLDAGRNVLRIDLGEDVVGGVEKVVEEL